MGLPSAWETRGTEPRDNSAASSQHSPTSRRPESSQHSPTSRRPESSQHSPTSRRPESSQHSPTSRRPESSQHSPTSRRPESSQHSPTSRRPESSQHSPTSRRPESSQHSPTSRRPESSQHSPTSRRLEPSQHSPTSRRPESSQHSPTSRRPESSQHSPTSRRPESSQHSPTSRRPESSQHSPTSRRPESSQHSPTSRRLESSQHSPTSRRPESSKHSPTSRRPESSQHSPTSRRPESSKHSPTSRRPESSQHSPTSRRPESSQHSPTSRRPESSQHSPTSRRPESSQHSPTSRRPESSQHSPTSRRPESSQHSPTSRRPESSQHSPTSRRPESSQHSPTSRRPESSQHSPTSRRPESSQHSPTSRRPESSQHSPTSRRPESSQHSPTSRRPESSQHSPTSRRPESSQHSPTSRRPESSQHSPTSRRPAAATPTRSLHWEPAVDTDHINHRFDGQPNSNNHEDHACVHVPLLGKGSCGESSGNDPEVKHEAEGEVKHEAEREVKHEAEREVTKEKTLHTEDDGVPYDRGWAWVVVLGLFVNFFLLSGYLKSSGVFFVELLLKFNAPVTHTALLFAIRAGVFSICGLYTMNVFLKRFGSRKLVMVGGCLMALSAILSSMANDLTLLICIHSFLLAAGMSMLISPGEVLVGHYFKRRRSLALSLAKCGASVGNVAIPPLVAFLLTEYGLSGTLLIYGGLCLHSLPAALLYRPPSFFRKRRLTARLDTGAEGGAKLSSCAGDVAINADGASFRNGEQLDKDGAPVKTVAALGDVILTTGSRSDTIKSSCENGLDTEETTAADISARLLYSESSFQNALTEKVNIAGCQSDSRIKPTMAGKKNTRFQVLSKSEIPSLKQFSTLEGNVVELAKSNPELEFRKTQFRKRSLSEPRDQTNTSPDDIKHSDAGFLDILSHSNVIKYLSVSSLDMSPAVLSSLEPYRSVSDGLVERRASCESLDSGVLEDEDDTEKKSGSAKPRSCCRRLLAGVLRGPKWLVFMLDFSLFADPLFRLLLLYIMVSNFVNISVDYLPALAGENGVSEAEAATLLSVIGGLDLLSRLACGFLADLRIARVPTMIAAALAVMAVATQFVRFLSSFRRLLVLAVLQGLFGGVGNCLAPVLIIDFVGLDNMGKAIGFCQLASGMSMAAVYPFLGYIRDVTGSYVIVYHVIGCGVLVASGLLCCEGTVRRLSDRKRQAETDIDVDVVVDSDNGR